MSSLKNRLNQIIPRITSDEFLNNSGLGNEIAFYIFDYPPEQELEIRKHIQFVLSYLKKNRPDLKVKHINLFSLLVDYLKSRNLLERALQIQKNKGDRELLKANYFSQERCRQPWPLLESLLFSQAEHK